MKFIVCYRLRIQGALESSKSWRDGREQLAVGTLAGVCRLCAGVYHRGPVGG